MPSPLDSRDDFTLTFRRACSSGSETFPAATNVTPSLGMRSASDETSAKACSFVGVPTTTESPSRRAAFTAVPIAYDFPAPAGATPMTAFWLVPERTSRIAASMIVSASATTRSL